MEMSSSDTTVDNSTAVLWTKIGFIVVSFVEAMVAGMIPTWSSSCRESPKILGIANSFAGGVFLAIAFMHITPEMIETWNTLPQNSTTLADGTVITNEKVFPLPELMIFCGYTFILIIDKVLFDTHALFEHDHDGEHDHNDPAEQQFEVSVKASMAKSASMAASGDPADLKKSRIEEKEDMNGAMKSYLNPHDRFATRMKASMRGSNAAAENGDGEQQNLFVDKSNVDLERQGEGKSYKCYYHMPSLCLVPDD
jgi:zinc transporter ZupT